MIISEKLKKYMIEKQIHYIVIEIKRDENFSGCGCSSKSVVTYSPKADFATKIDEDNYIIKQIDDIKIAIVKEIESAIKEDTKMDLIGFFNKSILVENYTPKVIR